MYEVFEEGFGGGERVRVSGVQYVEESGGVVFSFLSLGFGVRFSVMFMRDDLHFYVYKRTLRGADLPSWGGYGAMRGVRLSYGRGVAAFYQLGGCTGRSG